MSSSASVPQADTKGKSKGKNVKMRLIPGRIAGLWGIPTLDEGMEAGELENVLFCSRSSLRRVRRKLASEEEGEGAIYVRLERPSLPKVQERDGEGEEAREAKEVDEGLEGWLAAWDDMPEGCCVLAGAEKEGWSRGMIRSVVSCHQILEPPADNQAFSRYTPSWSTKRLENQVLNRITIVSNHFVKVVVKREGALILSPATPSTQMYPGVDKVRDDGIGYLRRTIPTSSRPLLITGGKGSGKSSVARAIADVLEADRDVLAGKRQIAVRCTSS
jgi:peroxin-1